MINSLVKKGLSVFLVLSSILGNTAYAEAASTQEINTEPFEKALLSDKKDDKVRVYDGTKLHFHSGKSGLEKATTLFEDDFSSGDLGKWEEITGGVQIITEDGKNAVRLNTGSSIKLPHNLPNSGSVGFFRLSFDTKATGFDIENPDHAYWVNIHNSDVQEEDVGTFPFKQNEWVHYSFVYSQSESQQFSTTPDSEFELRLTGSRAPIVGNPIVDITNFKLEKIDPTFNEDFDDGTLDSRLITDPEFSYSFVPDEKGGQRLKVDTPPLSLPQSSYRYILRAEESLAGLQIGEQGFTQEGLGVFAKIGGYHQGAGSLFGVVSADGADGTHAPTTPPFELNDPSTMYYVANFMQSMLPNANFVPENFTYGVGGLRTTSNLDGNTIYIDNIEMYKGIVNEQNTDTPNNKITIKRSIKK
ncbi:hypothetical protein HBP99_17255 [Listeria booriae]|uniref:hypothetical protein n=1 Tax=Listeria booriae TaxID=1552123 RepID=UPI0016237DCC|nr:hypothetical protein [Listeria booriae]MBC2370351.1 hypothetical protein [Listeria booriae]